LNDDKPVNDNDNVLDVSNVDLGTDDHFISPLDIYNPRNWDILDAKMRYILIKKGYWKIEYQISYRRAL
jgi:hypothetical protein